MRNPGSYLYKTGMLVTNLLLVCFFCAHSYSQGFSYMHYGIKDGLPSPIVYDVTQDANGFIWFATENGLCRFDGKNFRIFSTKDGLPDNAVMSVGADNTGRVFFNCFTHPPYIFYKDSIYPAKATPEHRDVLRESSFYTPMGDVYSLIGIKHFAIIGDSLIPLHYAFPGMPPDAKLSSGTNKNFFSYTPHGDTELVYVAHGKEIRRERYFRDMQLNPIITSNGKIIPLTKFTKDLIRLARVLNNDMFAFIQGDTIHFLDLQAEKVILKMGVPKPSCAFCDSEDNIWITTLNNGVYRIPSIEFRHTRLPDPSEIFSLGMSGNNLLVGNEQSVMYSGKATDSVISLVENNYKHNLSFSINMVAKTTNRNRIMKIVSVGDTTYIGFDAFLLKKTGQSKIDFAGVFPIKDIDINGSTLFASTGRNVVRLDAVTLAMIDTIFPERSTCGIFYDGDFYIGTVTGLAKINLQTKQVTYLNDLHPGLRIRITDLQPGIDDDIWIGTSGNGLIRMKHGKIISTITESDGLTSDICTTIFRDGNNLWVGTNKGLNKVDISLANPRIISFTVANGLASDFVNAVVVDQQRVYVGSTEGLTYFNKNIETTRSICRFHIMRVSLANKVLPIDSSYTFSFSAVNFRVDFVAISFKSAGDNTYMYKLEGLDDDWNITANTFVNYATLPPGEYTFTIKAVNKFGVESETKSIRIIITPPWWQTGWFITLAGITFAALVFFIYRRNITVIKRRERVKRHNEARFAALEQQALQAQMNPHFIFNCLNSIQSFILDLDAEGANQYLSAFASMIRQTLDISSHPLITVAEEMRYLDTYLQLEKLRFREKFNYRLEIDDEIDTFGTWIPGMFLQPYIENSLRHGIQHRADNEGLIVLSIRQLGDGGIVCRITDNGVGRKKAAEMKSSQHIEYQSKGTLINSKRINAINNQFDTNIKIDIEDVIDSNGEVAGTQVSIFIPQLRKP